MHFDRVINVFRILFETSVRRSSHRKCSRKKVFLKISQNSQEKTCARVSFLVRLQVAPATLLKKRLWHRCFSVNFAKFLRTYFSQNTSGLLLLCSLFKRAALKNFDKFRGKYYSRSPFLLKLHAYNQQLY